MDMDEMMREINKYPNGTYLKLEWEDRQLVLEGIIDTIYETDNRLDEEDTRYREFYACAFKIEKTIQNLEDKDCNINNLIEISVENQPSLIMLYDGSIVWKNKE